MNITRERARQIYQSRILPRLVANGECRELSTLGDNGHGYVPLHFRPHREYAHRVAYLSEVGDIVDGLFVLHKCDHRSCCRPDHLFLGTQSDNMRDMDKKGRRTKVRMLGTRNPAAKLDREKVAIIRASSESNKVLATRFCVTPTLIRKIRSYEIWKEPTGSAIN